MLVRSIKRMRLLDRASAGPVLAVWLILAAMAPASAQTAPAKPVAAPSDAGAAAVGKAVGNLVGALIGGALGVGPLDGSTSGVVEAGSTASKHKGRAGKGERLGGKRPDEARRPAAPVVRVAAPAFRLGSGAQLGRRKVP